MSEKPEVSQPGTNERVQNGAGTLFSTFMTDLRFAMRRLRKNPGFALVSVLTLALGIGASTAIFSAVNPILFSSLPYPHSNRVVMIYEKARDGAQSKATFGTYHELSGRSHSFEKLAVTKPWQPTITGTDVPERLDGQQVSAGYFQVLGVPPALGREFTATEDLANGPQVVMLSDALWKRRFGGDREIVGKQIKIDDANYTVVGVMPSTFENVLAPTAQLWSALQYDMSQGRAWGHHLNMVGRLQPDSNKDQANHELEVISHSLMQEFPNKYYREGFILHTLQDQITEGVRPALLVVLGAVGLVLLMACVNVINLLLARGAQRSGEFATRAALGAAKTRLIRQLLTESLVLAIIGGAVGMLLAEAGVRALVALSPPGLPRASAITVDGPVLIFGVVVTALIGVFVGLIPAMHASRENLQAGLHQTSARTAGGHQVTRRVLVVGEVALAFVLLVGAGLLYRSLQHLFSVDPGFDTAHLLTMQVQTVGHRFDDAGVNHRFYQQVLDTVHNVPGVKDVAFTSQLPLSGESDVYGIQFESSPVPNDPEQDRGVYRYAVSPNFFETVGIPLRRGRLLDGRDTATAPPSALINESLAKRKFPGQDPIGQRIHVGRPDIPWFIIVGVVGDVKQTTLAARQNDSAYITDEQWYFADHAMWLVIRTRDDPAALAPAVRNAIWSVDKDQPIARIATMDDLVINLAGERHFALILFEIFAIVALVLAATGIYGVLAGSVSERTREIGVRSALGASRGNILGLILRQGMILSGLGIVIGLSGAVSASQVIITLLFGVSRLDPATYIGVVALLFCVSCLACWVPAWRAARVNPSIAMRVE